MGYAQYTPPDPNQVKEEDLGTVLYEVGRRWPPGRRPSRRIRYVGNLHLLKRRCCAIVGTRNPSNLGRELAESVARELVRQGTVVVSGLARGIDTAAHRSAIEQGGFTVAVIATPLEQVSPKRNAYLQQIIYREHLLISPKFANGNQVKKWHFVKRNEVIAALCDYAVIVEASESSGAKYVARECYKLGRPFFYHRSLVGKQTVEAWFRTEAEQTALFVADSPTYGQPFETVEDLLKEVASWGEMACPAS